jgi:hypothetical protein
MVIAGTTVMETTVTGVGGKLEMRAAGMITKNNPLLTAKSETLRNF